ncbi:ATP-dependent RNA helicase HrpA [Persicirhabdus sediminis]|uniref:RNA helicase n=1 Tax=Persicirhabdus sediminis TaxID=454144 RepID=A0A8J7SJZ4_9BACT|nr:ATP-dependent RNA helicase HrpA [Persicirhabdus sediminis]MBK1791684.1 ATP-dependent RNA helicase HrpA [Persicirhabdus sediminis]
MPIDPATIAYPELPVSRRREDILHALARHQVVVVIGDTGSGKTTQLPKMALEWAASVGAKGRVGCTQPRRIAAVSVAKRVAEELKVQLGNEVGYQVRFDESFNKETEAKFMTDGILLAETLSDKDLRQYSCIMIDEAHERSLNIDFLLGYLKQLLVRRKDLKLIISSATLDAGGFAEFFNDAPVLEVEGRTFPVDLQYLPQLDREDLASHVARAVDDLSKKDKLGDVLVFLPGEREIREVADTLEGRQYPRTDILPLFARLGIGDQQRVFTPMKSRRRIVLATNVAETSLTIPGMVYVIDSGIARVSRYSPQRQIQRLQIEPVSQASARQRQGRCGRVCPGVCVRLYDEEDFLERSEFTDPEIRRSALSGVILRMMALKLPEITEFPFIDPPTAKHVSEGYRTLREVGAIGETHQLTPLGRDLSRLPVDPRLGRMLLEGYREDCLAEMLVIVSGLSIMDPRERPAEKAQEADAAHAKWKDVDSDFMSLLHLWRDILTFREGKKWKRNQLRKFCKQRYLNFRRVLEWDNLQRELTRICIQTFRPQRRRRGKRENQPAENPQPELKVELAAESNGLAAYENIHRSILAGVPRQFGIFEKERRGYKAAGGREFAVFPGSGLFSLKKSPEWLLAFELVDTSRVWARKVAVMKPEWLEDIAPHLCRSQYHSAMWDKKHGAVYGKETVLCGGLKIIINRRVHYGRVDEQAAREVFILEGLLGGGLRSKPPFLKHLNRLKTEVESLEHKLRRGGGLWHDEGVVEFFQKLIPAGMCTAKAFHRWRTKLENDNPKALFVPIGDVVYEELGDDLTAAFPDILVHGEQEYQLYYRYAPGEVDDGLTIGVHIDQLAGIPSWLPQWLVPGMLEEKIYFLIRSLPKQVRISCNPVAEKAEEFTELWWSQQPKRGLLVELADYLSQKSGQWVEPKMFDVNRSPDYLHAKLWVYDDDANELASGNDLDKLCLQLADVLGERVEKAVSQAWESTGMKGWECGELPEQVVADNGTGAIGFPALYFEKEWSFGVKVPVYKMTSDRLHRVGCAKLFEKQYGSQVRHLQKQFPLGFEGKMTLPLLGADGGRNFDDLVNLTVVSTLGYPLAREANGFALAAENARGELHHMAKQWAEVIEEVISLHREVNDWVEKNQSDRHLGEVADDLRDEMAFLLRAGFIERAGPRLKEYPRYFKAMVQRLQRIDQFPLIKDVEKMDQLHPLWDKWLDAVDANTDNEDLDEVGWLLAEYRVKLFAPSLPVAGKVSEKVISQQLDLLSK